jgi:hypothetical protein
MKPSKTSFRSFSSFVQGNRAIAEIQFADYIFPAFDQACLWFHPWLLYALINDSSFCPSPGYLYIQSTCSAGPHDIICVPEGVLFLCSNRFVEVFFARLHFFNAFIWIYLFPMHMLDTFSAYICLIYVLCQSNSCNFFVADCQWSS